jgi:hypothetical protein
MTSNASKPAGEGVRQAGGITEAGHNAADFLHAIHLCIRVAH